jgi:hypothetical protein
MQAWGVNIAGAILQNSLKARIPPSVLSGLALPPGTEIAYTIVPLIPDMPPATKAAVQDAFFRSLQRVWIAMLALSGVGLCTMVLIKDIPLRTTTDKKWDRVEEKPRAGAGVGEVEGESAEPGVDADGQAQTGHSQGVDVEKQDV